MENAFKAYDIRGIWEKELTREMVYKTGYFLPKLLNCKTVLVGHDIRLSSDEIYSLVKKGITDSGCDVIAIDKATTPMVYFSTVHFDVDASIQITASHNPKIYNGLKISGKGAIPVGVDTGLKELEKMVRNDEVIIAKEKGKVMEADAKTPYLAYLRSHLTDFSNLKIAIDCSNGMSALLAKELFGPDVTYINDVFDGNFPNHEPNPLDPSTCRQLQKTVIDNKCDLGIIYDGDADRVMFIDEKGTYIYADISMAVLGIRMLEKEAKGSKVVADIRSSKNTVSFLEKLGAEVLMWKVGHVHAKAKIRETGAVFGGELAGHYYFRDFFNCDSAFYATLNMLPVVSEYKKKGITLSQIIESVGSWVTSGEINYKIENKDAVISKIREVYEDKADKVLDFDGYRFDYPKWWFNVRKSNTEPYLRLVVEAETKEILKEKLEELKPYFHD